MQLLGENMQVKMRVAALSSVGLRFIHCTASSPPRVAESWQGTRVSGKLQGCSKLEILKHPYVKFVVICALQFKNLLLVYARGYEAENPEERSPFNTRLKLTTVWSGCWLPNRSSCHDLRDTWNSRLGLSSCRHHPLCRWFIEGDLRDGLAAKTLRLNESFQMGSVSKLMFS